ncbi:MAG: hypothetical protein KHY19_02570 [Coprobacillus cateniformis]|nr:hypothetical protein [Coprobacillus cateniformis]
MNSLKFEGKIHFDMDKIMNNLDDFNKLLSTNFTSISSQDIIHETVMNKLFTQIEGSSDFDIRKLEPYITIEK